MKRNLLFVFLLFVVACTKKEDIPEDTLLWGSGVDEHGIQLWDDEHFIFNCYYSLVDTFSAPINFHPSVYYYAGEDVPSFVRWKIKGKEMEDSFTREWQADDQKWYYLHQPVLPDEHTFTFGDVFEATVVLGDIRVVRKGYIKENKITGDVYGLRFGMSKQEVREIEESRLSHVWLEPLPTVAAIPLTPKVDYGTTLYRFTNGILSEVGEYTDINMEYWEEENEHKIKLIRLAQKYGLNEDPVFDKENLTTKKYIWNNGKIEFEFSVIDDLPTHGRSHTTYGIGITYRPLKK